MFTDPWPQQVHVKTTLSPIGDLNGSRVKCHPPIPRHKKSFNLQFYLLPCQSCVTSWDIPRPKAVHFSTVPRTVHVCFFWLWPSTHGSIISVFNVSYIRFWYCATYSRYICITYYVWKFIKLCLVIHILDFDTLQKWWVIPPFGLRKVFQSHLCFKIQAVK